MTEEIENIENELEETSTEEVVKTDKKYSDSDVQRIVSQRVKREKESVKKLAEDFETERAHFSEEISKYEEILGNIISAQLADYPDWAKSLVSKLPLLEQHQWLSDEKNKISKKEFPQRKQPDGNLESKPKPNVRKFM